MKYKVGDSVYIKEGYKNKCGSYHSHDTADHIMITGIEDGFYSYNIYDKGGNRLTSCGRCFEDEHLYQKEEIPVPNKKDTFEVVVKKNGEILLNVKPENITTKQFANLVNGLYS